MQPHNLLSQESSPYLLQHKDNPVWWHPWGKEAFERAAREDKPVFLSIGYSTCYWCHVMEHDSFEQQAVADVLNEHFVSIKVDREEFPDVDQIYMDVVVGIHGHGGWPMSVFLTPERKPFWGGTFFYRDQFIQILRGIAETWRTDRSKIEGSTTELMRYLVAKQERPGDVTVDAAVFRTATEQLLIRADSARGGFGGAPKFPPSQQLLYLMRVQAIQGDAASLHAINTSLSGMARGGIFDQVGGGFHRYSVDAEWLIPHFEKMLYDNALLAQVYLEGAQLTGNPLYRMVAARTLDYMVREMRDPCGVFQSAEDAGEVEREGEFYAWRPGELVSVLGDDLAARVGGLFGVTEEGNFERQSSVLHIASEARWGEVLEPSIKGALGALYQARRGRVVPHRDTKVLSGWNGLAIAACAKGFQVLGELRFLAAAREAATWMCEHMLTPDGLKRRACGGNIGIDAVLEDYAYLIEGLVVLFAASGEKCWLTYAMRLQDEQDRRLWSAENCAYRTSASEGLIVEVCEWSDGATPSPNGISLSNLIWLSELSGEARYAQRVDEMVRGVPKDIISSPAHFCSTLRGLMLRSAPPSTVVVASAPKGGGEAAAQRAQLAELYVPFTSIVWKPHSAQDLSLFQGRESRNDADTYYVCVGHRCSAPTGDINEVRTRCAPRGTRQHLLHG